MTHVLLTTVLYGDTPAIARDVTAAGLRVELALPLALGSTITVTFLSPASDADVLVASATVRRVYVLNAAGPIAVRAYGLRFDAFEPEVGGGREPAH